jgi:3'-5' exoribonuclease
MLRLSELTPDQYADCFVLLIEKKHGLTRDGKPYYSCRFRDARREAAVMVWSDDPLFNACAMEWEEGQCFKVRGTYQVSEKYGPQLKLAQIRLAQDSDRAEGFNPDDLVEHSRFHPEEMLAELRQLAGQHITDEPLRKLVLTLLEHHAEPLSHLPATLDRFHPFRGGLLEHTLSVTRNCLWLAERYAAYYEEVKPPLNRDLVVAGAILHDIGRVVELEEDCSVSQATVPGRLFGHLILGRDLVREAAHRQGDVNPELLQLLEHLILTHLTLPEWGSPRLPMIPEVLILHHADDLDAKLEMYARCLSRDQSPGPFTDRDPSLGKQLLKDRAV